jgi:hypothetical protein
MRSLRARIAALALLGALSGADLARATPPTRPPNHSVDPAMVAAEAAWRTAETTQDPADAPAAWEAAAFAFGRAAEATTGPAQAEARYAAVLAWRNALNVAPRARAAIDSAPPSPTLTPREAAMVDAIDAYLPLARADEVADLMFVRAMVFHRHARHADVIPAMAAIVTGHADADVAEYAANVLLDALNLQARYDEMLAWVVRMRATARCCRPPDLARTLDALHVQGLRKQAEVAEASNDAAGFARCAAIYQQIFHDVPRPDRADELLYNGALCAERGGAIADSRARYQRLLKRFPRSPLAAATRARLKALRGRR